MTTPIVLTDPPRIVELKREFSELYEREQQIKFNLRVGQVGQTEISEMEFAEFRKAQIAQEIYDLQHPGELPEDNPTKLFDKPTPIP